MAALALHDTLAQLRQDRLNLVVRSCSAENVQDKATPESIGAAEGTNPVNEVAALFADNGLEDATAEREEDEYFDALDALDTASPLDHEILAARIRTRKTPTLTNAANVPVSNESIAHARASTANIAGSQREEDLLDAKALLEEERKQAETLAPLFAEDDMPTPVRYVARSQFPLAFSINVHAITRGPQLEGDAIDTPTKPVFETKAVALDHATVTPIFEWPVHDAKSALEEVSARVDAHTESTHPVRARSDVHRKDSLAELTTLHGKILAIEGTFEAASDIRVKRRLAEEWRVATSQMLLLANANGVLPLTPRVSLATKLATQMYPFARNLQSMCAGPLASHFSTHMNNVESFPNQMDADSEWKFKSGVLELQFYMGHIAEMLGVSAEAESHGADPVDVSDETREYLKYVNATVESHALHVLGDWVAGKSERARMNPLCDIGVDGAQSAKARGKMPARGDADQQLLAQQRQAQEEEDRQFEQARLQSLDQGGGGSSGGGSSGAGGGGDSGGGEQFPAPGFQPGDYDADEDYMSDGDIEQDEAGLSMTWGGDQGGQAQGSSSGADPSCDPVPPTTNPLYAVQGADEDSRVSAAEEAFKGRRAERDRQRISLALLAEKNPTKRKQLRQKYTLSKSRGRLTQIFNESDTLTKGLQTAVEEIQAWLDSPQSEETFKQLQGFTAEQNRSNFTSRFEDVAFALQRTYERYYELETSIAKGYEQSQAGKKIRLADMRVAQDAAKDAYTKVTNEFAEFIESVSERPEYARYETDLATWMDRLDALNTKNDPKVASYLALVTFDKAIQQYGRVFGEERPPMEQANYTAMQKDLKAIANKIPPRPFVNEYFENDPEVQSRFTALRKAAEDSVVDLTQKRAAYLKTRKQIEFPYKGANTGRTLRVNWTVVDEYNFRRWWRDQDKSSRESGAGGLGVEPWSNFSVGEILTNQTYLDNTPLLRNAAQEISDRSWGVSSKRGPKNVNGRAFQYVTTWPKANDGALWAEMLRDDTGPVKRNPARAPNFADPKNLIYDNSLKYHPFKAFGTEMVDERLAENVLTKFINDEDMDLARGRFESAIQLYFDSTLTAEPPPRRLYRSGAASRAQRTKPLSVRAIANATAPLPPSPEQIELEKQSRLPLARKPDDAGGSSATVVKEDAPQPPPPQPPPPQPPPSQPPPSPPPSQPLPLPGDADEAMATLEAERATAPDKPATAEVILLAEVDDLPLVDRSRKKSGDDALELHRASKSGTGAASNDTPSQVAYQEQQTFHNNFQLLARFATSYGASMDTLRRIIGKMQRSRAYVQKREGSGPFEYSNDFSMDVPKYRSHHDLPYEPTEMEVRISHEPSKNLCVSSGGNSRKILTLKGSQGAIFVTISPYAVWHDANSGQIEVNTEMLYMLYKDLFASIMVDLVAYKQNYDEEGDRLKRRYDASDPVYGTSSVASDNADRFFCKSDGQPCPSRKVPRDGLRKYDLLPPTENNLVHEILWGDEWVPLVNGAPMYFDLSVGDGGGWVYFPYDRETFQYRFKGWEPEPGVLSESEYVELDYKDLFVGAALMPSDYVEDDPFTDPMQRESLKFSAVVLKGVFWYPDAPPGADPRVMFSDGIFYGLRDEITGTWNMEAQFGYNMHSVAIYDGRDGGLADSRVLQEEDKWMLSSRKAHRPYIGSRVPSDPTIRASAFEKYFIKWFRESDPLHSGALNPELFSYTELSVTLDGSTSSGIVPITISRERMKELGMVMSGDIRVCDRGPNYLRGEPPPGPDPMTLFWITPKPLGSYTFVDDQGATVFDQAGDPKQIAYADCFGIWDPLRAKWKMFPERSIKRASLRTAPVGVGYGTYPDESELGAQLNNSMAYFDEIPLTEDFAYVNTALLPALSAMRTRREEYLQKAEDGWGAWYAGGRPLLSKQTPGKSELSYREELLLAPLARTRYYTPSLRHLVPDNAIERWAELIEDQYEGVKMVVPFADPWNLTVLPDACGTFSVLRDVAEIPLHEFNSTNSCVVFPLDPYLNYYPLSGAFNDLVERERDRDERLKAGSSQGTRMRSTVLSAVVEG